MKVCLICNQIAAWGKIGGFGSATRALGRGLAERGVEVTAVIPRRAGDGQEPVENLDGITVYGTESAETFFSGRIFRRIDADVYHSQEPTVASYLAQRSMPNKIHIVTCRDPRGMADHMVELRYTNLRRRLLFPVTWAYEAAPWVKAAVRNADSVFMPAPSCLTPRIQKLYGRSVQPLFVPSPVDVPESPPVKDEEPLVIFVGRWDHRKRIERFFALAERFPHIRFMAIGRAHDSAYDARLRQAWEHLSNVEMPGFVPRFGPENLNSIYARAWILVNTSAREGLPYTFIEAGAWGCSILSSLDPDHFARDFGYYVEDDDFAKGLAWLLESDRWRARGRKAMEFVRANFSEERSLDAHMKAYVELCGQKSGSEMGIASGKAI
ncbi:MAG: glycosyltransferase family 4 protein [Phycisphaeraceae bacterium]|nr:glycosyltransferase family 4 protein [Phycisphaeraceae bacterium]